MDLLAPPKQNTNTHPSCIPPPATARGHPPAPPAHSKSNQYAAAYPLITQPLRRIKPTIRLPSQLPSAMHLPLPKRSIIRFQSQNPPNLLRPQLIRKNPQRRERLHTRPIGILIFFLS